MILNTVVLSVQRSEMVIINVVLLA